MNGQEFTKVVGDSNAGHQMNSQTAGFKSSHRLRFQAWGHCPLRAIRVFVTTLLAFGLLLSFPLQPIPARSKSRTSEVDKQTRTHNENEEYLLISTDASPDLVVAGSNVTYTLAIKNEGTTPAAPFVVNDTLPTGTSFVSCEAASGGICGGVNNERTINFNTLAPESSATVTLVATVNCSLPDGTEINNTATLRSLTPHPEDEEDENETISILVSNPAPLISAVTASPIALGPPNHKMVSVTLNYTVTDNCGPIATKLQVASNEPINGTGDGDTAPDWTVVDEHHVLLRAERSGNGSGRIYTLTITATDSADQSSIRDVVVSVPKNASK